MRFLFVLVLVGACRGQSPEVPPPAAASDHALKVVPLGQHYATRENPAGSPGSMRDRELMEILQRGFGVGDCRVGGECWLELGEVSCDRQASRCTARDLVDQKAVAATGQAALDVIDHLVALDRALGARTPSAARCDAKACRLVALACASDRHDELAQPGKPELGATYTCDDSRRPLAE